MAKVEPLYNLLNQKLQAYGIFHEDLSIDELMVLYYGHHFCTQFICIKPITFGCKLWVLASATYWITLQCYPYFISMELSIFHLQDELDLMVKYDLVTETLLTNQLHALCESLLL